MLNKQPIEKSVVSNYDGTLDVHSIFYTIQGEGPFQGHRAVFLRLAGCNLQCPLCDTEYTEGRKSLPVDEIVNQIGDAIPHNVEHFPMLVVITGGEPFRQHLTELVRKLLVVGYYVQIETNGTLPVSEGLATVAAAYNAGFATREPQGVYIICSPKTGKVSHSVKQLAFAWKYVLKAEEVHSLDGLPYAALNHSCNPWLQRPLSQDDLVYLQPCDEKDAAANKRNLEACVQVCMQYGYVLQQQMHKQWGLE